MDKQAETKRGLEEEYGPLADLAEKRRFSSYSEFDKAVLEGINLFAVPRDEPLADFEAALDMIIKALPAFKRIFSKPITRLSDTNNVLPVEAVRVINDKSIAHAVRHSETWGDISEGELRPKKLMTLERREDYVTYENIVFVQLVKHILAYVKRNIRLLKDTMYANRELRFNLLESTNHINYFLALGKLHIGYIRDKRVGHDGYDRCLDKMILIDRTLRSKLNSNVYRQCEKKHTSVELKRTNVFRLHKDYKQVYELFKKFSDHSDEGSSIHLATIGESRGYAEYCAMLTVFAAGHLNFSFRDGELDFSSLLATADFGYWKLSLEDIRDGDVRGLSIKVYKDREYRVILWFGGRQQGSQASLRKKYPADEHLFVGASEYGEKDYVYLCLYDVDSFRRLQQIMLRAMIYSDDEKRKCPFCGRDLARVDGAYECEICKTQIMKKVCSEKGEGYYVSGIKGYKIRRDTWENSRREQFMWDKVTESVFHYRNITPMSANGEVICPRCGKIHGN